MSEPLRTEPLSTEALRVLGTLIEKERATPQNYPLTANALRLGCNQSSNRFPVVDYDDDLIERTVTGLKQQGLLRFVFSSSNRATKYRHVLDEAWRLADDELAVLCVLFLRGPQTIGEIKGRTERLHPFADLAEVQSTLERLARREPSLVRRLDRQPGQKDSRWVQLAGVDAGAESAPSAHRSPAPTAAADSDAVASTGSTSFPPSVDPVVPSDTMDAHGESGGAAETLRAEVRRLRSELDALRSEVVALRAELDDFRAELGG